MLPLLYQLDRLIGLGATQRQLAARINNHISGESIFVF
jgi:hypothetical protein